jgi:hypothetical protein
MITNTPVGVLAAIVILPSGLDVAVVHGCYARLAPAGDHGRNDLCARRLCLDYGQTGSNRLLPACRRSCLTTEDKLPFGSSKSALAFLVN